MGLVWTTGQKLIGGGVGEGLPPFCLPPPMSPASDLLFSAASRGRAGIKSEIFGRPEW